MRKTIKYAILLTLMILLAGTAWAQEAVLKSVDVKDNEVLLKASGQFTYTIYKPSDPYLVVVELPGVAIGDLGNRIVSEKKGISEIKLSETGQAPSSVLKLEILLDSPADIEPSYSNNSLTLTVKAPQAPVEEEKPKEVQAKEMGEAPMAVKEPGEAGKIGEEKKAEAIATEIQTIDFEYTDGTLRLIIKADGAVSPTIFSLGDKIIIDVPQVQMKASLPESVVPPVKSIRYGMHKDKVRLVVDLKGKPDFNTYSEDDSIVVAFRVKEAPPGMEAVEKEAPAPVVEEKITPIELADCEKKVLSLDFQGADVIPIFRLFADVCGFNIIVHPGVGGNVTFKLVNVTWQQGLATVLELSNMDIAIDGNIMSVAPAGFLARKQEDAKRKLDAKIVLAQLVEDSIPLDYAEASEIKTLIEAKRLLSGRGSIDKHPSENTLLIRDTEDNIKKIREFIEKVNTPVLQVMIEAKIVEVNSDFSQTLGIRWTLTRADPMFTSRNWPHEVDMTATSSAGAGGGGLLNLNMGTANSTIVNLSLDALETIGKLKKLSNPKLLTMNMKSASIQKGLSIPVATTTAAGSSTQFINANLNLQVTPTVKGDYVQIVINVANDTPSVVPGGGTGINKQSIQTQAVVKDGETLVIGGIYSTSDQKTDTGVPYLMRIPIIGWLFKSRTTITETKELMIFITPIIVKQVESGSVGKSL